MGLFLSRRRAADLAGLPPFGESLPKARRCFCGCGRKIPFYMLGLRMYNTRGRQVRARLARMEPVRPEASHPDANGDARAWFAEGELFAQEIAELVHRERDPREMDEGAVREWQVTGRAAELDYIARMANLGHAIRNSGLSEDEAAGAIARGEFKPD